MSDPYLREEKEDFRKTYYKYFSRLGNVKKISLRGKQVVCLMYLAKHPVSSAYNIGQAVKRNKSSYTWAKLALPKLLKRGLIRVESRQKLGKKEPINYSLTDEGIFYLIKNTKVPNMMLLRELIRNYCNSDIFSYLIYPYMSLDTLTSPKMSISLMAAIGDYLVSVLQRMDRILELLKEGDRSDKERYHWDYDRLEEYLRDKFHFDFLSLVYSEEDFDDNYVWIRYFDYEDANKDVKVVFDVKNKKGYVYVRNKRVKKHDIPFIADYLKKRIIKHDQYVADQFSAFCKPSTLEFVLPMFSKFQIDTFNDDTREILSNDKDFMESLKEVKDSFDTAYRRIRSYPNFVF